jgi:hypothetical protein
MRYLCLLIGEPGIEGPVPGTPEFAQMLGDYESATLRVRDGRPLVTDGPFAELKEQIGGYYVLDCADLDEALRRAATIPAARYGAIEVRPLMVPPGQG